MLMSKSDILKTVFNKAKKPLVLTSIVLGKFATLVACAGEEAPVAPYDPAAIYGEKVPNAQSTTNEVDVKEIQLIESDELVVSEDKQEKIIDHSGEEISQHSSLCYCCRNFDRDREAFIERFPITQILPRTYSEYHGGYEPENLVGFRIDFGVDHDRPDILLLSIVDHTGIGKEWIFNWIRDQGFDPDLPAYEWSYRSLFD